MTSANLWLIGMMGAGKTAIAPLVAARLGLRWVDSDEQVAAAAGAPVPDVLAESAARFRQVEAAVVEGLVGAGVVVATGGGVVTSPSAVATMRSSGLVVWLRAPASVLIDRVGDGRGRPLLGDDPAEAMVQIAEERAPQYAAAAHVIVDGGTGTPAEVAERVATTWLREVTE